MRKKTMFKLEQWIQILTAIESNLPAYKHESVESVAFRHAIVNLRDDIEETLGKRMERWKRKQLGLKKKEYDGG